VRHNLQAEGNFCDEHGKAEKLSLVKSTVGTWTMSTEGTDCLIAVQLVGRTVEVDKKIVSLLGPNCIE
jgi:hypothetical protein